MSIQCVRAFVFFFQAEDGIRDVAVTGVQTCALPISSEDASTYTFFRCSSHANRDSILCSVLCQKYLDLPADSRSRSASLKGASTLEATLASPGSTFSRYLSAFLTATYATCMSNPKNFTLFVCFGSWLYLRIQRIMFSTSSVFQVQKWQLSSASSASPRSEERRVGKE